MVVWPEKIVPPFGLMAGRVSVLHPLSRMHKEPQTPQSNLAKLPGVERFIAMAFEVRGEASILQDHTRPTGDGTHRGALSLEGTYLLI